jgi:hypothetical protein
MRLDNGHRVMQFVSGRVFDMILEPGYGHKDEFGDRPFLKQQLRKLLIFQTSCSEPGHCLNTGFGTCRHLMSNLKSRRGFTRFLLGTWQTSERQLWELHLPHLIPCRPALYQLASNVLETAQLYHLSLFHRVTFLLSAARLGVLVGPKAGPRRPLL